MSTSEPIKPPLAMAPPPPCPRIDPTPVPPAPPSSEVSADLLKEWLHPYNATEVPFTAAIATKAFAAGIAHGYSLKVAASQPTLKEQALAAMDSARSNSNSFNTKLIPSDELLIRRALESIEEGS